MPSGVRDIQLLELKDTISQLNNTISTQNELIRSLQKMLQERDAKDSEKDQLIANLQAQLDYLKTRLFGSTSEIRHEQFPGQLDLFHLQTEDEPEPVPLEVEYIEVKAHKKARKPKAAYDEAFYEPTKVIGRYMSKEDAEIEVKKGNYVKEDPGKGFRRVVAAPKPIDIVEIEAIRALAAADQVVIACGGGGIPVIEQKHALKGASAVIEKDAIAGKLASDLSCDELIILTTVPYVYKNFGKEDQTALETLTVAEAKDLIAAGQFEEGTMLPKIEAAISYLEKVPAGKVLITSMDHVKDAIKGKAGTVITA